MLRNGDASSESSAKEPKWGSKTHPGTQRSTPLQQASNTIITHLVSASTSTSSVRHKRVASGVGSTPMQYDLGASVMRGGTLGSETGQRP